MQINYEADFLKLVFSELNPNDNMIIKFFYENINVTDLKFLHKDILKDSDKMDLSSEEKLIVMNEIYLKKIINDEFHFLFLDLEEAEKLENQFERKQFTSKLANSIVDKYKYFFELKYIQHNQKIQKYCSETLIILNEHLITKLKEIEKNNIITKFEPLSNSLKKFNFKSNKHLFVKFLAKLKNGYKYYELEKNLYENNHSEYKLESIIDFNCIDTIELLLSIIPNINDLLDHTNGDKYTYFTFLDAISTVYSKLDVNKLLCQCYNELLKNSVYSKNVELNLPLTFNKEQVEKDFLKSVISYNFGKYDKVNLSVIEEQIDSFIRLKDKDVLEKISSGEKIFVEVLESLYPNDHKNVHDFIVNNRKTEYYSHSYLKIRCSYSYFIELYLKNVNKTILDDNNTLNVFYLVIYFLSNSNYNFNELFYMHYNSLISDINEKLNIHTTIQSDNNVRSDNIAKLTTILNGYSIKIKNPKTYIPALLSHEMASLNEIEEFKELEMIGDAIYNLAAADVNHLVVNYYYNDEDIFKDILITNEHPYRVKDLKCKEFQIALAKELSLDQLYIKSEFKSEKIQYDNFRRDLPVESYLADSLEMIIGAIYKEFGVKIALDFAFKLILKIDRDVIKYDDFKAIKLDKEIFPHVCEISYCNFESYALDKLLKVIYYGCNTKEKRKNINLIKLNIGNEHHKCLDVLVYNYLREDIENLFTRFGNLIKFSMIK